MLRDRHMFIVRQQGIVRTQLPADIERMMDARIKVGVVTDTHGQMQLALIRGMQVLPYRKRHFPAGQQLKQTMS